MIVAVDMWQAGLGQRLTEMLASDPQVKNRVPDPEVAAKVREPGTPLTTIVQTIMDAYADRPAVAQPSTEIVVDQTGRHVRSALSRFDTISYAELWADTLAIATAWQNGSKDRPPLQPGDVVCTLGVGSIEYASLELACIASGVISIPLISNATADQWKSIIAETKPRLLAVSADLVDKVMPAALSSDGPHTVLVFDYHPGDDSARENLESALRQTVQSGRHLTVQLLHQVRTEGHQCHATRLHTPDAGENPLAQVIYTSGATGSPKGAMYTQRHVSGLWIGQSQAKMPAIVAHYMPMSHVAGRMVLTGALARGGTCYFVAGGNMSKLLDDISLVRPTEIFFIPRVCELVHDRFRHQVETLVSAGSERHEAEQEARKILRNDILGGRVISAINGSAPLDDSLREFMASLLETQIHDAYGNTEAGGVVMLNNKIQRPPVIEYKLADVPELGYFSTDQPHPRGELLLKTVSMIPGYYNRPELNAQVFDADGYYRTGDVMAQVGPDELRFVERRNNVLKLSQAEFVAVAQLEATFTASPMIDQIYIYGQSGRADLLAVIVPSVAALEAWTDEAELRTAITESLQRIARDEQLHPYEIPRDFLLETEPFSADNGLLNGIGKPVRPNLRQHYESRLDQLYQDLADGQASELAEVRRNAGTSPVLETVRRAAQAFVGSTTSMPAATASFADLGGDSMSAYSFGTLLSDTFGVEVPASVILGSATDLQRIAQFIEAERETGASGPTAASVHGTDDKIRASELTLDRFISTDILDRAHTLPAASHPARTVLLTGANGYLGRFLALHLLEQLQQFQRSDARLVCLVRGSDADHARRRLAAAFGPENSELHRHFQRLSEGRLEVIAGDVSQPNLGLSEADWSRLATDIDAIVNPAALVNHVLPYDQLFRANVVGTAELIRLAITTRRKAFTYLSTVGVADQIDPTAFHEDSDIRDISPVRTVGDSYANGYANTKWASEVLLRRAHELCDLPVAVFRSNLILGHSRFPGQINLPDMFTRLLFSVVATGIAPQSFYRPNDDGTRKRTHFDGLPVDFTAEAVATIGTKNLGYRTFNVVNTNDDGVSLDSIVDWLIEAGHPIQRITDYGDWIQRFEIALNGLPDDQVQQSVLPLLHAYRQPEQLPDITLPAKAFEAAVHDARIGSGTIPQLDPTLIRKYVADLQAHGLLQDQHR